ncbi:MAG: putative phage-type endonuclease [Firmicutes bacterium]|nr:putative phage-type endonuclease [Bacillota bacterium]
MKPVIVCRARDKTNEEWWQKKLCGLCGSDAASAIGEDPYLSPVDLWLHKTGQVPFGDAANAEEVIIYKIIESAIANLYVEKTKNKIRRRRALFQHAEYSFMLADIDREIIGKQEGLKIKNIALNQSRYWQGSDIPQNSYVQMQHDCAVMGWVGCHVAVLIGGQHFFTKYIPRDDNFIVEMIPKEQTFWQEVVAKTKPQIAVAAGSGKELLTLYPKANGQTITLPVEAETWLNYRLNAIVDLEAAEQRKAQAENNLKQLLGDNEVGYINGIKVVEWVNVKGREMLDSKELKASHPEIYAKYLKIGNPTRRFLVR